MTRTMPAQRPGRSEQTVCTPREFLDAVEKRFGPIRIDLAATAENKVALLHLGPGSPIAEDALACWPRSSSKPPPSGTCRPSWSPPSSSTSPRSSATPAAPPASWG